MVEVEGQRHRLLKCAEGSVYVKRGYDRRRMSRTKKRNNFTPFDIEVEFVYKYGQCTHMHMETRFFQVQTTCPSV